jgi:Ca2+-binding RTX toxin-like protein
MVIKVTLTNAENCVFDTDFTSVNVALTDIQPMIGVEGRNDTMQGNTTDEVLDGGTGDDTISAGDGNNTVFGGAGSDNITAGVGDDVIDGGDGADQIVAGDGRDSIVFDALDIIDGGQGVDALRVNGPNTDFTADTPRVSNLEVIDLSADNTANHVLLDQAFVTAMGGASAVISINGSSGDTVSLANDPSDPNAPIWYRDPSADVVGEYTAYKTVTGTSPTTAVTVLVKNDVQVGNAWVGSDNADTFVSGPGSDTLTGGAGIDEIDLTQLFDGASRVDLADTNAVTVNLTTGTASDSAGLLGTDTLVGIENVKTGKGNDSVHGYGFLHGFLLRSG